MKKNNIIMIAMSIAFVLMCIITFGISSKQKNNIKPVASTFTPFESSNFSTSSQTTEAIYTSKSQTDSSSPLTLPADNHFETNATVTSFSATNNQNYSATNNATVPSGEKTYTDGEISKKMCLLSSTADTWTGNANDDTFVPYLSSLPKGTMDYIVSAGEKYDEEEEMVRRFYTLSCGVKVLQESVQLVEKKEMGDNSINAVSSAPSPNGDLTITISEKWKVPFLFSFSPQNYYAKGKRQFCVTDFTASAISFTFYHSTSFSGTVNTQGSAVVSSAQWSRDINRKTVTLTLPLLGVGKYYGFSSAYDINGNLVLTIHNKPKALSGSIIMLDAGHGGKDSGSLSPQNIYESEVNRAITAYTKSELEKRGAAVLLTRDGDRYLSLDERREIAYAQKPDIFVSIHCDGSKSEATTGTSAYYFKPMSKPLAQFVHDEIVSVYRNDFYLNNADKQSKADRECAFHPFRVTRIEDCPSILIESGFITNEDESAVLYDSSNQQKIAVAIANGIEKYITSY